MRMKPCLTAEDAARMMTAARNEALKNSWNVTIAIVDASGVLLNLERLDNAGLPTVEVSTGKAKSAALMGQPTRLLEERANERPSFLKFPLPMPMRGGLPILYGNECIGGIGAAGVKAEWDEQIASAGVAAFANGDSKQAGR